MQTVGALAGQHTAAPLQPQHRGASAPTDIPPRLPAEPGVE